MKNNMCSYPYRLMLLLLFLCLAARMEAQRQVTGHTVRGELVREGQVSGDRLDVEIRGQMAQFQRTTADASGSFEFYSVPEGLYELKVSTPTGEIVAQTLISVPSPFTRVQVRMPDAEAQRPVSGTVSVERLRHEIPAKAKKEFVKSEDAQAKGKSEESLEHLQKAVQIDPEFMEAYNNLGARYLKINQIEKALDAFERAARLDPHADEPLANAGVALLHLRRPQDAEQAARRALELNSQSQLAHFVLGLALASEGRNLPEALQHLQRASEKFPKAQEVAAQIEAQNAAPAN